MTLSVQPLVFLLLVFVGEDPLHKPLWAAGHNSRELSLSVWLRTSSDEIDFVLSHGLHPDLKYL